MSKNNLFSAIYKVNHAGGSGSCFYYKKHNIFITNFHVVEGYKVVSIQDNDKNSFLARVVMVNPSVDIAFLIAEWDFKALPDIVLSQVEDISIWQKINVAGYPFGMPFTLTEWTISAPKQLMDNSYYIQTDAAVNPGNSWWPMFNDKNELIAITVSKFNDADNMGFWIPVSALKKILEKFDKIDTTKFNVQCNSCEEFIIKETEYCPSCWAKLKENIFKEDTLTDLAVFVEEAISLIWINPILARTWYEVWKFHKWSSEIRIFVYNKSYLFCTSPINILPKKDLDSVLTYLLSDSIKPYQFGLQDNQIYLSYRVHLSDVFSDFSNDIKKNLSNIVQKADELDDYLHDEFGCEFSEYSKKV